MVGSDGDDEEDAPTTKKRRIEPASDSTDPPKSVGLLSADTIEGLKYFSEIRKRHEDAVGAKVVQRSSAPKTTALALDYGSGSDEE